MWRRIKFATKILQTAAILFVAVMLFHSGFPLWVMQAAMLSYLAQIWLLVVLEYELKPKG